ncbi:MAG: hypothetical protein KGM46_01255 [Pseudomonadota bacterium]|jgi:hypothetical protein|nr:hypothetical protein [Xanthomonadaceae bacterium]MDE3209353.1 hypothetical protein [Pseudomonadota bacterium]
MQTLKVSVSFPDATHPEMELRLSAKDADCDVVIALPILAVRAPQIVPLPRTAVDVAAECDDEYTLGGYAGI